jgi:hypothetical protein
MRFCAQQETRFEEVMLVKKFSPTSLCGDAFRVDPLGLLAMLRRFYPY